MKRGCLIAVFLFVAACFFPLALAPPVQANENVAFQSAIITSVEPAALPGLYDPAAMPGLCELVALRNPRGPTISLFAEVLENYFELSEYSHKIHRGVWDNSLAKPWTRSLEVSEMLIYDDQFAGTKGNTNKIL